MAKNLMKVVLGSLLSILIYLSLGASAPLPVMAESSLPPAELSAEITHFLTSLPGDYYTISNTAALKNIIKSDRPLLIDVRTPAEYAAGHIPNAINIPLPNLTENLDKIPSDRPVILYCTTGYRTAMGVMSLQMLGYSNVRGFPPSFQGWKLAGEPLEK